MKTPYLNTTERTAHLGGVSIPPGCVRDVEAADIPGADPAPLMLEDLEPADGELNAEHWDGFLARRVVDILPDIPGLAPEHLSEAAHREERGQNRKTLLEAFLEAQMDLAAGAVSEATGE